MLRQRGIIHNLTESEVSHEASFTEKTLHLFYALAVSVDIISVSLTSNSV